MKKTAFILVIILIIPLSVIRGQNLNSIFKEYGEQDDFEMVSINKMMMMFAGMFVEKDEKELLSKISGVRILTSESGKRQKSLMNDIKLVVNKEKFENLVKVRDKGEHLDIYYKEKENGKSDLLIVSSESSEVSVIWISGKLSKEELNEYQEQFTHSEN